jgi:hypothetical protein
MGGSVTSRIAQTRASRTFRQTQSSGRNRQARLGRHATPETRTSQRTTGQTHAATDSPLQTQAGPSTRPKTHPRCKDPSIQTP